MHVTLHMAVSIDGFVARTNGQTDWVSAVDLALFEKRCKEIGCAVMGKTTFDEVGVMDGVSTIVLTHQPESQENQERVTFVSSPQEALKAAESKGHATILLSGGGTTNGAFLKPGLIDEIYLTVHPIVLGEGIRLFGDNKAEMNYTLLDTRKLSEQLVELHYTKA